jgi:hypothetical protein
MNLLDTQPTMAPEITSALRAYALRNSVHSQWLSLQQTFADAKAFVWSNADGLTPQQALDLFGTDAGDLFSLSNLLCGLLKGVTGEDIHVVPAGWTYTVNADNTVTVQQTE